MAIYDNKFLTFKLKDERYGIPIIKIREIIGMLDITSVPRLPSFIKGVINLRGKIIPVVDLRLKFGIEEIEYNERTSIIVVELTAETDTNTIGIVVDTVQEVLDIDASDIEPPPKYGTDVEQAFLIGIGKVKDEVIMLLDADNIFSSSELQKLETV
ncbi:MAG: chemotaxis protein CheW [Clostridiales bacterium]|nr:chemotaxis protein CheW [Clostridiales bacterium]